MAGLVAGERAVALGGRVALDPGGDAQRRGPGLMAGAATAGGRAVVDQRGTLTVASAGPRAARARARSRGVGTAAARRAAEASGISGRRWAWHSRGTQARSRETGVGSASAVAKATTRWAGVALWKSASHSARRGADGTFITAPAKLDDGGSPAAEVSIGPTRLV